MTRLSLLSCNPRKLTPLTVGMVLLAGVAMADDTLESTTQAISGRTAPQKRPASTSWTRKRPGMVEADDDDSEEDEEETVPAATQTSNEEDSSPEDPNGNSGLEPVTAADYRKPSEFTPVSDRWRLPGDLGLVSERWFDPYNFNIVKGDRPAWGRDWFYNLGVISDTVLEPRRLPPSLASGARNAGDQFLFVENLILALSVYKGETVYRPPDVEFRFSPVINSNYTHADSATALRADPTGSLSRWDHDINLQQVSVDLHLRTVSDRYDFDRIRIGIQPFTADNRGFLYLDNPIGARLYGTRDNNIWQYNLAVYNRIEKGINSGLNELIQHGFRDDQVFVSSLYKQDFPVRGFISQATAIYNRNREGSNPNQSYDHNGFPSRPSALGGGYKRNYDVVYLGYNGDGHLGRVNLTTAVYGAVGNETAGPFTGRSSSIGAWFTAIEASMDFDWIRPRLSILHGSGDGNPYDRSATGFDAILESPVFAGGETSFWIRQAVPYSPGIRLSGRNGVLNAMRSSKEQGQSNFTNPGIQLYGLGVDFEALPELRVSFNANKLFFDNTAVLEATSHKSISMDIGWDTSIASIYRPFQTQNIILRLSGAMLIPGDGFKDIYGNHIAYSVLSNLVLAF